MREAGYVGDLAIPCACTSAGCLFNEILPSMKLKLKNLHEKKN